MVKQRSAPTALTRLSQLMGTAIVAASLWSGAVFAKDPFRTTNPRNISAETQAAFEAFFKEGNYPAAAQALAKADPQEPLALAMKASLTYTNMLSEKDQAKQAAMLSEFQTYAGQTRSAAQSLLSKDPLRGNLYLAVSHFLDGVYAFTKEGSLKGTAKVLGELQEIIKYLNAAEAQAPDDPELNLLRGYIDVYSGIYLPFSDSTKGIDRLKKFAGPSYLAERGLAMGYLEMEKFDQAIAAVDRAIAQTPGNPELAYLKAKILIKQKQDQASIPYLEQALQKEAQLPTGLVKEMKYVLRKAKERIAKSS